MTITAKRDFAWKERTYPVPSPGPQAFRWKASAMRRLHRWSSAKRTTTPPTIVVPALYNRLPGETVALGWLNEIQALQTIRQRILGASRKTGWDVYTFHTQHNLDRFFDTTIAAVADTWTNEGILFRTAMAET